MNTPAEDGPGSSDKRDYPEAGQQDVVGCGNDTTRDAGPGRRPCRDSESLQWTGGIGCDDVVEKEKRGDGTEAEESGPEVAGPPTLDPKDDQAQSHNQAWNGEEKEIKADQPHANKATCDEPVESLPRLSVRHARFLLLPPPWVGRNFLIFSIL